MLAAAHRLTGPDDFRAASREGRRAGSRSVVTHLLLPAEQQGGGAPAGGTPPRAGFVVSKGVGNAVVRNRVKRRLRHAVRERIDLLPDGAVLVVRAQPASASASSRQLGEDLDRCLERVRGTQVAR